jgi:hypothetical protein
MIRMGQNITSIVFVKVYRRLEYFTVLEVHYSVFLVSRPWTSRWLSHSLFFGGLHLRLWCRVPWHVLSLLRADDILRSQWFS